MQAAAEFLADFLSGRPRERPEIRHSSGRPHQAILRAPGPPTAGARAGGGNPVGPAELLRSADLYTEAWLQ